MADFNNRDRYIPKFYETTFTCSDADDDNWDGFSNTEGYSPRNEAFDNAVKFYDLWMNLIGVSPHSKPTSHH